MNDELETSDISNWQQPEPQQRTPQTPISITLPMEQWNAMLMLLNEVPAPYRVVAPLINVLLQQMQGR